MTTFTESFTAADNTTADPIGGDLTWTKLGTTTAWRNLSNRLREELGSGIEKFVRAEHSVSTDNNSASITLHAGSSDTLFYVCARYSSSANTGYGYLWRPSDGVNQIISIVDGIVTSLASGVSTTASFPVTLKIDCNGSSIKGYIDGVEKASVTDTSITTGKRGGLGSRTQASGTADFESFEVSDLAGGVTLGGTASTVAQGSVGKTLAIQL